MAETYDYAILGLGKTGRAVLDYLTANEPQAIILVSDSNIEPQKEPELRRRRPKVFFELGVHSERVIGAKTVIKSPGIFPAAPVLRACAQAKVKVISELDFACQRLSVAPAAMIGVTGTNGKTTTTHLLGHLFAYNGFPAVVAGNIGEPLIGQVQKINKQTFVVLEVSSYQIEDSSALRFDCGLVLNITPDHLDHHGSWKNYVAAKAKIFSFGKKGHAVEIVNFEDPNTVGLPGQNGAWRLAFSSRRAMSEGACIEMSPGGILSKLCLRLKGKEWQMEPSPSLIGAHNLENQMAACLAGAAFGLTEKQMTHALASYKPPPHRLEFVAEIKNILYINDSKATNVASTVVALQAVQGLAKQRRGKIHLLLGGLDKGVSYKDMARFNEIVVAAYVYGQAQDLIARDLGSALRHYKFKTLDQALAAINNSALPRDIVLLSPACASFDQFDDFEARGNHFKMLVIPYNAP